MLKFKSLRYSGRTWWKVQRIRNQRNTNKRKRISYTPFTIILTCWHFPYVMAGEGNIDLLTRHPEIMKYQGFFNWYCQCLPDGNNCEFIFSTYPNLQTSTNACYVLPGGKVERLVSMKRRKHLETRFEVWLLRKANSYTRASQNCKRLVHLS